MTRIISTIISGIYAWCYLPRPRLLSERMVHGMKRILTCVGGVTCTSMIREIDVLLKSYRGLIGY